MEKKERNLEQDETTPEKKIQTLRLDLKQKKKQNLLLMKNHHSRKREHERQKQKNCSFIKKITIACIQRRMPR